MSHRLIVETPTNNNDFEYIVEEKNVNEPKNYFIKGPYMMAESVNKNKRIYSIDEMVQEVQRYTEEMIVPRRAVGELNHPESVDVDLERACHVVTELTRDGNVFYGKSKVLSTPSGLILRSLINDGVKVGMSTRGLGMLISEGSERNRVKNFRLVAVDCVADPSFSKAFVNGILESKQYVLTNYGFFEEKYDKLSKNLSHLPVGDREAYIRKQIIDFIKSI